MTKVSRLAEARKVIMKKKNTKEKIAKAAIEVFAKKGFENSKVSDIAKKARVAQGTIYLHFQSKDKIFTETIKERLQDIISLILYEIDKKSSFYDKAHHTVKTFFEQMDADHQFAKVLLVETRRSDKLSKELSSFALAAFNQVWVVFKNGIEKNEVREIDVELAANMFLGAIEFLAFNWLLQKQKFSLPQLTDAAMDILWNGMSPTTER